MDLIMKYKEILISLYNIFLLNLIFAKNFISKNKTIIFYFPKKKLTLNNIYFLKKKFLNLTKFEKLYYLSPTSFNNKNFFLVKQYFLKFIFNCDYFISNHVSEKFTNNSKKIYIHHDIYDTPLVGKKDEKNLRFNLLKYDFIVCSSNKSKLIFKRLLKKDLNIKIFRYTKLDYAISNFKPKKKNIKIKTIIIAPTNFYTFKKLTIKNEIKKIISYLLKENFNVIFRPHPSNFDDEIVKKINNDFKYFKTYRFDNSYNYFSTFYKSDCLLTDVSGIAYTYSFLNLKPVIFYRINKKLLKKEKYENLNYFKDRKIIGYNCNSLKKLRLILKKNIDKTKIKKILKLREEIMNIKKFNINEFN